MTALLAILSLAACENESEPEKPEYSMTLDVSSDNTLLVMEESGLEGNIRFKAKGGSIVLDVVTNQDSWTFTNSDDSWLEVTADDYFLTLTASPNTSEDSPSSTVEIIAGEGSRQVTVRLNVSQNYYGQPEISVSETAHNFVAFGGDMSTELEVDTNMDDWTFECYSDWLLVEPGENSIRLSVDENEETEFREAEVTLIAGTGDKAAKEVIRVSQDGVAYIYLDSRAIGTDYEARTQDIRVYCNPELEWNVSYEEESWYKVTKNEDGVTVAIDANADMTGRNATLTFSVGHDLNTAAIEGYVFQIGTDTDELIYEVETEADETVIYDAVCGTSVSGQGYVGGIDVTVDWGDGSDPEHFTEERPTHEYKEAGRYVIISTGKSNNLSFTDYITKIISWGKMGYTLADGMCAGSDKLCEIPNDVAGSFSDVTTFAGAFEDCAIDRIPPRLLLYASKVTTMQDAFREAPNISEIPEDLLINCTAVTDFTGCFKGTGTGNLILNDASTPELKRDYIQKYGKLKEFPAGLFRNCSAATKFSYAIAETAISTVPSGLLSGTAATTLDELFNGCALMDSVPSGFFSNIPNVTSIYRLFYNCISLKTIPADFFEGCSKATRTQGLFYNSGIESLPAGVLKPLSAMTSLYGLFQNCENLKTIDGDAFEGLSQVTSVQSLFEGCSNLETVPSDLFKDLTGCYDFSKVFYQCASLKEIPAGLFDYGYDYKNANFQYAFRECTSLKTLPSGLFDHYTKTTKAQCFQYTFQKCSALESIPAGLFLKNAVCTNMSYTFTDCTSLKEIPSGGFFPPKVTTAAGTFTNCTSLTAIPEDMFCKVSSTTKLTTLQATFSGCTSLEAIPEDLLSNLTKLTTLTSTFSGCMSLKEIPEKLLAKNTAITKVYMTFSDCRGLTGLPAALFTNNKKITTASGVFSGCENLTGESPYYTTSAGVKVHLYERTAAANGYSAIKTANMASMYKGCTKLDDYDDMPSGCKQ